MQMGSESAAPAIPAWRGAAAWLNAALWVAALAVLASYAVIALTHLRDRYQVNFTSGVYAGLASSLNAGTFYPDLYDGEHYAGTRYMPLSFVLHAGLARLTGEYLISGKILTYALTALLCAELFLLLRRLGCGRGPALVLASLVLLNKPGFFAATTIRGDLLPVVLQLGAVLVAFGPLTLRRAVVAAALCALAILSKQTAVWAPLAIACYHLPRHWRLTLVFLAATLGAAAAGVFTADALSGGRMFRNMSELSVPGGRDLYCLLPPVVLAWRTAQGGPALAILIPLVIVECLAAFRQRRLGLPHWCLLFGVLILLAIFTDPGTNMNHLLDLVVVSVPVIGSLWASLPAAGEGAGLQLGLGVGLVWAAYVGWAMTLVDPLREAVSALRSGEIAPSYAVKPLANLVPDDSLFLADDAWIALARNRTPCVLDTYSLARMTFSHPQLTDALLRRVEAREFKQIVVTQRLDRADPHARFAYEEVHFGRPIVEAVCRHYRLLTRAEDYFVYVPRDHEDADARVER